MLARWGEVGGAGRSVGGWMLAMRWLAFFRWLVGAAG